MPLVNTFTYINLLISFATIVGCFVAFRVGIGRQASEIQERVITALNVELDALRNQIESLRAENKHLLLIQDIVIESLRKRGIEITIEKSSVTIVDQAAKTTNVTRIQEP